MVRQGDAATLDAEIQLRGTVGVAVAGIIIVDGALDLLDAYDMQGDADRDDQAAGAVNIGVGIAVRILVGFREDHVAEEMAQCDTGAETDHPVADAGKRVSAPIEGFRFRAEIQVGLVLFEQRISDLQQTEFPI